MTRLLPFIGPAFIASIAYVYPGNFATNIAAGAQLGYTLLWVIILSNLFAMVIQSLSAKLGIATGKNLAEHCRESLPKWIGGMDNKNIHRKEDGFDCPCHTWENRIECFFCW